MSEDRKKVDMKLSLSSNLENVISTIHKEYLEEEMNEIPAIQKGQVKVQGTYVFDNGDNLEAKIFILNGLEKNINFTEVPFAITNSKKEVMAYQIFDLSEIEEIPSMSARPLKIYFDKKNVFVDKIPLEDWEITFDTRVRTFNYVNIQYEKLPEGINEGNKKVFEDYLNNLKIEKGNIDVSTFTIVRYKNGNLLLTVVICNGTDKILNLERLPILIKDEKGEIVAQGIFGLEDFKINPNKARILSLVFEKDLVLKEDVDLDKCKVIYKGLK